MTSMSVDFRMEKLRGLMNWSRWAYNPPATPAKKAEIRKAYSLRRRVSTDVRLAATSSSRMAVIPRPKLE